MLTEADTCRKLVTPNLLTVGWDTDPHSIAEQRSFTDGRIIVRSNQTERRKGKRADYILRYTRDFPIAVVEAKATGTATRNFADPAFDGDPAFATQEEIDETGKATKTEVLTAENAEDAEKNEELHEAQPPYNASLLPSEFSLQPSAFHSHAP